MSTTVNYKGSELVEFENATKVLKTQGKYLEDDITIQDVSSSVTVEALNATQNGTYEEAGKAYSPVTVNVASGERAISIPIVVRNNRNAAVYFPKTGFDRSPASNYTDMRIIEIAANGSTFSQTLVVVDSTHNAVAKAIVYYDGSTSALLAVTASEITIPAALSSYITISGSQLNISSSLTQEIVGGNSLTVTLA